MCSAGAVSASVLFDHERRRLGCHENPDDTGDGTTETGSLLRWTRPPGTVGRAMVALGTGPEPFGADDEAVLALLARMASVALERSALYETLRSNEQRLTALVESSPLAIAELDLDGNVRWWNRAAGYLFGWDESGRAARAIPVAGDAAAMLDELWDRARRGMATVGALVPAHEGQAAS